MRQVPCLHKFKIQQRRQILSKSMLKRLSDFSCEEWIRSEWWGVISGDAYLVWRAARLILVRNKATLKPVADLVNRKGKRWEWRRHFRERPVCANTHRQKGWDMLSLEKGSQYGRSVGDYAELTGDRWGRAPAEDKARSCSLIEKQLPLKTMFFFISLSKQNKNRYLINTCSFQFVPTKGKRKKKKRNAIQSLSHSWWVGKKLNAFLLPVFPKCGLFVTEGLSQSSPKNQNICIYKMRNWLMSPWGLRSPNICSWKGGNAVGPMCSSSPCLKAW